MGFSTSEYQFLLSIAQNILPKKGRVFERMAVVFLVAAESVHSSLNN